MGLTRPAAAVKVEADDGRRGRGTGAARDPVDAGALGERVVELVLVLQLPMATQAAAASSAPPGLLESPVLGKAVGLPGLYGASRQWLEARLGEGALMRSPGTVGLVLALISAIF